METKKYSQKEWGEIVSQFNDLSLLQLWEYGEAKAYVQRWRVVRHVWRENGVVVGAAQAMVKTIPVSRKGVVWINRAPLWQKGDSANDGNFLLGMLDALRNYWVDRERMYLRIAPPVIDTPEARLLLRDAGYQAKTNSQWISSQIDLAQPEGELLNRLRKRWRSTLCRAQHEKILVFIDDSDDSFHQFLKDYSLLIKRKKFNTSLTVELLEYLQRKLPTHQKMLIIRGMVGDIYLGSILIGYYGSTAEYIAGAINEDGKRLKVGRLLLWSAIREMRKRGYSSFDLGGCHPEKTPAGILHFKKGFGGTSYCLVGEFDAAHGCIARAIQRFIH